MKPELTIVPERPAVELDPVRRFTERKRAKTGACRAWILEHANHSGDECLVWPFSRRADGRPLGLTIDKRSYSVCRFMCELAHGAPENEYMQAAHRCGRAHEGCVNPRHLYWATPLENKADCKRHGTHPGGENNPRALLTEEDVIEICQLRGVLAHKEIAAKYGVSKSLINQIFRGAVWGHVSAEHLHHKGPLVRTPLSKKEYAEIYLRQAGYCACGCGHRFQINDEIDDDHIIAIACGGTNDLANRQLLLRACHRKKTSDVDVGLAAKIKRQAGLTGQRARREKNGSRLKGRGFDKTLRKRMNGKVEKRISDDG